MPAEAFAPEATRRRLTGRQVEIAEQLVDAAEVEVEASGYDGLSVRNVARAAGVAPATAYTCFSSKDHLLAELLWRRIHTVPDAVPDLAQDVADRLGDAVRAIGQVTVGTPTVVAACTPALLSSNPDVKDLRDRIGGEIYRRLAAAAGADAGPEVVRVLVTTYFGALLTAGMGHMGYTEVPEFVATAARLMTGGDGRGAAA